MLRNKIVIFKRSSSWDLKRDTDFRDICVSTAHGGHMGSLRRCITTLMIRPRKSRDWRSAPWFKTFMQYFDIVEKLEIGTEKVFTVPVRKQGCLEETNNDPGRAYLPPIHWDVLVVHKDRYTKSTVDDNMLAHLKLGHASIDKLIECQQVYGLPHQCKQIPAD